MNFQLAWRNIWRNPRRTSVILTAVIIGVWSMICVAGLMRGIVDGMVQNGINTLTGHIQIHHPAYPDDPVVAHRITDPAVIGETLQQHLPANSRWAFRVRTSAVANNARHSTGVRLVGIQPEKESRLSFIGSSVTQGRYLEPGDTSAIVIGKALAEQLETRIGKKLILMSQDATGEIASRAFRIVGLFQAEMEGTEKSYIFVPIKTAQKMLKMSNTVSETCIRLPEADMAAASIAQLRLSLADQKLRIRSWQQILPMVTAMLNLYDVLVYIWFLVIFVAMGFGIVNTTLMSVFERMREFGLLKALGMRPIRIIKSIVLESALILLVGITIGNLLGITSNWLLSLNGIDLSALAQGVEFAGMARIIIPNMLAKDILGANLVVLLLGILVTLYPALKAARFKPVDALAHT